MSAELLHSTELAEAVVRSRSALPRVDSSVHAHPLQAENSGKGAKKPHVSIVLRQAYNELPVSGIIKVQKGPFHSETGLFPVRLEGLEPPAFWSATKRSIR